MHKRKDKCTGENKEILIDKHEWLMYLSYKYDIKLPSGGGLVKNSITLFNLEASLSVKPKS